MSHTTQDAMQSNFSENSWKYVGLVTLPIRFVQGFIFWAGGSRRFIYAPQKLDPHSPEWLANKLQSAMPGTLFGLKYIISFLLQHFVLLYTSLILFSLAELLCGLALLFGFFTRLAAFITVLLSITLMLIFGWEGATCLDEWTMSSCNLAMGLTLILSGAAIYSVDNELCKHYPQLRQKTWFNVLASGSWSFRQLKIVAFIFFFATVIFTAGTYDYYRGAIISAYHPGPVSPTVFHITLNSAILSHDKLSFTMSVDAGTSAVPTYIIKMDLIDQYQKMLQTWDSKALSKLTHVNIKNIYSYNQIHQGPYGLVAPLGAKATILLPVPKLRAKPYQLQLFTIDGKVWKTAVKSTSDV